MANGDRTTLSGQPVIERCVGGIKCYAPDYSVPGVAERVRRENEAFFAEHDDCPRNSMMTTYYMFLTNRRRGG